MLAHPVVVAVKQQPADRMVLFCVDTSGSMAGAPIQAAAAGVASVTAASKPRDVFALYTFNDTVNVVQKFARNHKINWPAHTAQIGAATGGGTALYDAALQSLDALATFAKASHSKQLRVLVLLTDGDDNKSQHSLDDVVSRVHASTIPNFHLLVLGVGVDRRKYAALCAKSNTHYIDVADASPQAIRDAFGTVAHTITRLQQRLIVAQTTTTISSVTSADRLVVTRRASSSSSSPASRPALVRPRVKILQR